jgi:uncharacterized protein (DUF736 family)
MNIGQITRRDNGRNGSVLVGRIDTLAVSMTIGLRDVNNPKPTAPKYEIMAKTKAGAWVRVGALFEQESRATGETFYQGQIEDPSMDRPLSVALFRNDLEDGTEAWNVAWSRRRPRQDLGSASRDAGDLGDSTAGRGEGDEGMGGEGGFPSENPEPKGAAAGSRLPRWAGLATPLSKGWEGRAGSHKTRPSCFEHRSMSTPRLMQIRQDSQGVHPCQLSPVSMILPSITRRPPTTAALARPLPKRSPPASFRSMTSRHRPTCPTLKPPAIASRNWWPICSI